MPDDQRQDADYVCLGCGSDVSRGDENRHCGRLQAPPKTVPLPKRPNPALPSERERRKMRGGWLTRLAARRLDRAGWTVISPQGMDRALHLDLDMSGFNFPEDGAP